MYVCVSFSIETPLNNSIGLVVSESVSECSAVQQAKQFEIQSNVHNLCNQHMFLLQTQTIKLCNLTYTNTQTTYVQQTSTK